MRKFGLIVAALSLVAACSEPTAQDDEALDGSITVYAADSLRASFETIGKEFEQANPDVNVTFDFGTGGDLAGRIKGGASADVFATADTQSMATIGGKALEAVSFAANSLQIAVPRGNPLQVLSLGDLTRWDVDEVVCDPSIPCGAATEKVVDLADISLYPVSKEMSAHAVLATIESGAADAGLVYTTDVKAAGSAVTGMPFPEAAHATNYCQITSLKDSKEEAAAKAFVAFVLSEASQAVFAKAGLAKP